MVDVLLTIIGLLILVAGAESLVRGAAYLARALGVSSLVVGLTIVAIGTSAPEFAVSVKSGLGGQGAISVGNVLGSNIFNILFILGLSAIITPIYVDNRLVRVHVPFMILVSGLVWFLGRNAVLGRMESVSLLLIFAVYLGLVAFFSRREDAAEADNRDKSSVPSQGVKTLVVAVFGVVLGLGLLVWGARLFVDGASEIARRMGVNELTIGLTLVAAGTSLPEAATSLVASLRGERNIAVGNIVGSNIFNLLCALAAAGLFSSGGLAFPDSALEFDMPIMMAASMVCLPVFISGARISRGEGVFFLVYYVLYIILLVLRASESAYMPLIANALIFIVFPVTALVLLVSLLRAYIKVKSLIDAMTDDLSYAGVFAVRNARKVIVLVIGVTIVMIGVAMMVLPGPAVIVIPTGLAVLGTEFLWARRLLRYVYSETQKAAGRLVGAMRDKEQ